MMSRLMAVVRSPAVRAVFLLVALAAAAWAVVSRRAELAQALADMNPLVPVGAFALGVVYIVLTMLAWRSVLADLGSPLGLRVASALFYVSQLGKYVPGGVWNILAVAELGRDREIPQRRSVAAMLVSVLISLVSGLFLAAASVPFAPSALADRFGWALFTLPVFVVILLPPVLNRVLGLALRVLRRPPLESPVTWRGVVTATAWTLAAWLVAGMQVWLLCVGMGASPSAATLGLSIGGYALAWSVGFLAIFVPAGAGVREAILAIVLGGSLGAGGVIAVVLLSRAILTIADLLLGLAGVVALRRGRRRAAAGPTTARRAP